MNRPIICYSSYTQEYNCGLDGLYIWYLIWQIGLSYVIVLISTQEYNRGIDGLCKWYLILKIGQSYVIVLMLRNVIVYGA